MIKKPRVSIIVPVYNMEKYLEECMQSVLNQTLQDIEIICVNDGSNDGSPHMLEEYAVSDRRVKVIHKANSGYGQSVNVGIEHSQGEYIGIVEPDDYIKPTMMETLYFAASKHHLDMISSNQLWFYGNKHERVFETRKIMQDDTFYNRVIDPHEERAVLKGGFLNPAGLFNRVFLLKNNIKHNETPGASFQDVGFCFQVLMFSRRIMLLNDAFYCYRQDNPASSTANKWKMNCIIEELAHIDRIMKVGGAEASIFLPELCYLKYVNYLCALERTAIELRKEFVYTMADGIKKMQDNGELYISDFPEKWKQDIFQIIQCPDDFYDSYMSLGYEIREKLENYNAAVIYGAGSFGKKVYNGMFQEDKKKIKGFAVTNLHDNIKSYKGVKVREISSYEPEKGSIAVIIGVTDKYSDEIRFALESIGFKNFITLNARKIRHA